MPSALENLIKIIRLEQKNGYTNEAVIGGLSAYAANWASEAHGEANHPEQHALIEEILLVISDYENTHEDERRDLAKYMFERLIRRRDPLPHYAIDATQFEQAAPPPEPVADNNREADAEQPVLLDSDEVLFEPLRPIAQKAAKPRRRKRQHQDLEEALQFLRNLDEPLTALKGVGDKMAEKLARIGPQTIGELLYLFPRRYDDYTQMLPLNKVTPNQMVTVIGTVSKVFERHSKNNRHVLNLALADGTGKLQVTFFNQPWLSRQIKEGMQLAISGKTDLYAGKVTFNNPEWEPIDQNSLQAGGIVPVYPLTKGVSARTMRRIMKNAVDQWVQRIPDFIPESVLDRTEMMNLMWAIEQIHFPDKLEYAEYARERLAFDELILLQLGIMAKRTAWQSDPAFQLPISEDWLAEFQAALPFELTGAQRRSIDEMRRDIATDLPMNRLLQGDVGAGKTLVAAVGLASAVLNGYQAAMMAPTGILAEQHFQKIRELFATIPGLDQCRVELLTGALTDRQRSDIYDELANGAIDVVIGTHAVIQHGVGFAQLGLAVIDEQHRFGVGQRAALRGKGTNPHLLVMSATPIPRTLALTLYADLDISVLDELPPGRTPIQTKLLTPDLRTRAYAYIDEHILKHGQQAYIIYPLVEASDAESMVDVGSAVEGFEELQEKIFPHWRLGLIHGRMKASEKDEVMGAFAEGELDILVSTTVIEVGVDVPNATAILIENAERFGLAQLHQLRGRVGRGDGKSYCFLVADEATQRLQALEDTTDGFKLAELDWQLRGAGDLLGTRQSGVAVQMRLTEIMDARLVALAQQEARTLYAEDPELILPEHALLAQRVERLKDDRSDLS